MNTRAVGYVRVSQARDEMISPELQRHQIEQYAKARGFEVVAYVEDLDQSGRQFTKRKVTALVAGITSGDFEAVILWKWSRWGRNLRESLIYLAQVEEAGGAVLAATEDFDPKTSMGRFTRDQLLLIAELQSNQIGDTWREVHNRRLRMGLPHGAMPRMGYTSVRDKDGQHFEIDPKTAPIVAEGYQRFLAGTSLLTLAKDWNRRGLHTKRGNDWNASNLGRMLDTGFAAGLIRGRSDPTGRVSGAITDFDVWRQGCHEPIIEQETWDLYKAKRLKFARVPRRPPVPRPLKGIVFCAECGRPMTPARSGKKQAVLYRCDPNQVVARGHPFISLVESRIIAAVMQWILQGAQTQPELTAQECPAITALAKRTSAGLDMMWSALTAEEQNKVLTRILSAILIRQGRYEQLSEKVVVVPNSGAWLPAQT